MCICGLWVVSCLGYAFELLHTGVGRGYTLFMRMTLRVLVNVANKQLTKSVSCLTGQAIITTGMIIS